MFVSVRRREREYIKACQSERNEGDDAEVRWPPSPSEKAVPVGCQRLSSAALVWQAGRPGAVAERWTLARAAAGMQPGESSQECRGR